MRINHSTCSPALDAVLANPDPPSPHDGGPCQTCAVRPGTLANQADYTIALLALCVEGVTPFMCHEKPGPCHGWIAAVNLKNAAGEITDDPTSVRLREIARTLSDVLGDAITAAAEADKAVR